MDCIDQLHVVSDLHLGGKAPHQVFNQGHNLSRYIDDLAGEASSKSVALVLNGDTVDFLAVPEPRYLDPVGGPTKLRDVIHDPAFAPVWKSLVDFVRRPNATLAIVIGNHDVELALPETQAVLSRELCGSDAACRGRIRFVMDGTGFACSVGGRRVLCVHGNHADNWNAVDHAELLHWIGLLNASVRPPEWDPNAGTRLVVDVLNEVKRRYPFVDLLKPETVAVPAVLLALPGNYSASLGDFARIAVRRLYDHGRLRTGFLGGEDDSNFSPVQALELLLRAHPVAQQDSLAPLRAEDLLEQAQRDHAQGRLPTELDTEHAEDTLGWGRLIWDRSRGRDPREDLRQALQDYLAADRSFDLEAEDEVFRQLDETAGDVDFIVAGHTHLERCLNRRHRSGVYYNSGTWMRLLRFTPEVLESSERFEATYQALAAGTLARLDETDLVLKHRTIVTIRTSEQGVESELRHVLGADRNGSRWECVEGSHRVMSRGIA